MRGWKKTFDAVLQWALPARAVIINKPQWPQRKELLLAAGLCCFCLAIVFLVYWPMVNMPLLTEAYVEQALARHSPWDFFFRSAYLQEGWGSYYRFGTRLIDHIFLRLGGGDVAPQSHHLFQVTVHVLCTGLLFSLIWLQSQFRVAGAAIGALLFGLHPSISGAVVLVAVRWSLMCTLLLLALANIYQLSFTAANRKPPLLLYIALSPAVFFLALTAEVGAVGMGVLGIWLAVKSRPLGRRWALSCLLPVAWVPVAYLVVRKIALGSIAGSYVEMNFSLIQRLGLYTENFLYDTTLLINPLQLPFLGVSHHSHSISSVVAAALFIGGILILPFLYAPSRRAFLSHQLPLIGLFIFALFQLKALWLISKQPIAIEGIDRGYVYYMPAMLLMLLVGNLFNAFRRFAASGACAVGIAAAILYIAYSAGWTQSSIRLWRKTGNLFEQHRAVLTPFLQSLDADESIYLVGFPDALREPYLPWTLMYYYTFDIIFEEWADIPLEVLSDVHYTSIPVGFSGWVITNSDGKVTWRRQSPALTAREYLEHHETTATPAPLELLTDSSEMLLHGNPANLGVTSRTEEGAVLKLNTRDSFVDLQTEIVPADYGILKMEIRIESIADLNYDPAVQIYFAPPDAPYSEARSLYHPVQIDGQWQEIKWQIFQHAPWMQLDRVTSLRFDFLNWPATIEIRNVQFENDLDAARRVVQDEN